MSVFVVNVVAVAVSLRCAVFSAGPALPGPGPGWQQRAGLLAADAHTVPNLLWQTSVCWWLLQTRRLTL